ncbi:nucleoside hydrolase [Pirellulaceae bacterium SH501]
MMVKRSLRLFGCYHIPVLLALSTTFWNIALVSAQQPGKSVTPTRVIIDADTANEIDDLYAIARGLIAPEFQVEGVSSAHFTRSTESNDSVQKSQKLNEQLLAAFGLSNRIKHPIGGDRAMKSPEAPVDSPAARWIIERAHAGSSQNKLLVIALGACTNLASALRLDPTIESKVTFAFIDGDFKDGKWGPGIFNWKNDIAAVKVIFESNVEYIHMPARSVSVEMELQKIDVDRFLRGRGPGWELLIQRWDTFPRTANKPKKVMWDLALIEALIRPELATAVTVGAPIILSAEHVEQFPDNPRRIKVFKAIEADGMESDFWEAVRRKLETDASDER